MKALALTALAASLLGALLGTGVSYTVMKAEPQPKILFSNSQKLVSARLAQLKKEFTANPNITPEDATTMGKVFMTQLAGIYKKFSDNNYIVLDSRSVYFIPPELDFTDEIAKQLDVDLSAQLPDTPNPALAFKNIPGMDDTATPVAQ